MGAIWAYWTGPDSSGLPSGRKGSREGFFRVPRVPRSAGFGGFWGPGRVREGVQNRAKSGKSGQIWAISGRVPREAGLDPPSRACSGRIGPRTDKRAKTAKTAQNRPNRPHFRGASQGALSKEWAGKRHKKSKKKPKQGGLARTMARVITVLALKSGL